MSTTALSKRRPAYKIDPASQETFRRWQFESGFVVSNGRQQRAIAALYWRRSRGVTALELARRTDPGDETAITRWAPPLSVLHKEGYVEKLAEKRDGYAVYVLPEYVRGRETVDHYIHHCPGCNCKEA